MREFNGLPKDYFGLFLKECEWRFNNTSPQAQLKQLKQWAKMYIGSYLGQLQLFFDSPTSTYN